MASDRVLIDATNQTFWQITNYKPGQRLDLSIPQDREMAERWREIYKQVEEYRRRATRRANEILDASLQPSQILQPYVLIVERRNGTLTPQVFASRANLDVQYTWTIDQTEDYTYAAMFDFTQKTDGPTADTFSVTRRRRMAVSGWY